MQRKAFQQELDSLLAGVLALGDEVEGALEKMVRAMEGRDAGLAGELIGSDVAYKSRGSEVEQEIMILQARQAPVAGDLRLLYTLQGMINHLVRSGTLCEHICAAVAETADHNRDEDLEGSLIEMARTAHSIFRQGLEIFKARDLEGARDLQAADDRVDLLYSEAMNLIANPTKEEAGSPEWRMKAALLVHYLERIADHGVDIGGSTVFLVTGERLEDAMRQYLERNDRFEEH